MRRALKAIDDVHGDGPLNELPFIYRRKSGNSLAAYDPWEGSNAMELYKLTHSELSIVHETGHWLDHFGFWTKEGAPTLYKKNPNTKLLQEIKKGWGSYGEEFKGFMEAARETDAIKSVRGDFRLSNKSRDYLLSNHEVFARAYAQWIAEKSGDEKILEQVNEDLQKARDGTQAQSQWEWEDFKLVSDQITGIFRAKGWLRK